MKIEEPIISETILIRANSTEEAKQFFEKQMSDPQIWEKFWRDLYQILVDSGMVPKWGPENCSTPIQIKNNA